MSTATPSRLTRSERLENLPFTRQHGRLLTGSGIGWALDAMDVGLISFVMAALAVQWNLNATTLSLIGSIGFVGMAIGASVGGLLADRIGRRQVFAVTLLVYGLATGAAALSWSVGALLVFRFLIGVGLGAELPVAATLVSEFSPARIRGRIVVLLEAFWAVGWLLAALIGYFVVPTSPDGWRWALVIGAVPTVYAVVVRLGLPESVRFLELRGREAEAEAAVRKFEESAGLTAPASAAPPKDHAPADIPGPGALWSPKMRVRTASLWAVWFGVNFAYYGAFIWLPSLLAASGFSLLRSFEYTLIITLSQLPGYLVAALLVELWGRRPTLSVFLVGSAVSAIAFGTADSTASMLTGGIALSFFNLGAWGALYAVTPEVYPTAFRATGAGWATGFGRIGSILAPLSVPILGGADASTLVFAVFATFFGIAAAATWGLPERRGEKLDAPTVQPDAAPA
jgi:putative MFS transporter